MPEHCDICGVAPLEGQEFIEEHIPLRRAKRYCPACHFKLLFRVHAGSWIVGGVAGVWGLVSAIRSHSRILDSPAVGVALVVLFQWLMIFPHELGHAAVARIFRFQIPLVLIGLGRPVFSLRVMGLSILINRIPLGGLAFVVFPPGVKPWKQAAVVSGGPLVNFGIAAIAWLFLGPGSFFDGVWTIPKIIIGANVLVLVENLLPWRIETPHGMMPSDGLRLLSWARGKSMMSAAPESGPLPWWELAIRRLVKWTGFLVMLGVALIFAFLAVLVVVLHPNNDLPWLIRVFLGGFMVVMTALSVWASIRILKTPIVRKGAGSQYQATIAPPQRP